VSYHLLWAHCGPGNFPLWLTDAIRQAMLFHHGLPHVHFYFLTNEAEVRGFPSNFLSVLRDYPLLEVVTMESLQRTPFHDAFRKKTGLRGTYERGTTERHFWIDNFIRERKLTNGQTNERNAQAQERKEQRRKHAHGARGNVGSCILTRCLSLSVAVAPSLPLFVLFFLSLSSSSSPCSSFQCFTWRVMSFCTKRWTAWLLWCPARWTTAVPTVLLSNHW
jgi:hypothetical protein